MPIPNFCIKMTPVFLFAGPHCSSGGRGSVFVILGLNVSALLRSALFLMAGLIAAVLASPAAADQTDLAARASGMPAADHTKDGRFCVQNVGYGPLRLSSQSPFQSLRLGLMPLTPSTLGSGEWEIFWGESLANVWAYSEDAYLIDYETLHSRLAVSYGISNTFRVELFYEERKIFGGILDDMIVRFHDVFGLDQDGRDEAPYGEVDVEIHTPEGETIVYRDQSGTPTRAVTTVLQHTLTCGGDRLPAVSYALILRQELASASPVDRSAYVDVGLTAAVSKRFDEVFLYLTGGYFWYGDNEIQGVALRKYQLEFLSALEWRYREDRSLILQLLAAEGQVNDFGGFSDYSYEITLGWKREFVPGWVAELGLIENIIVYENSPDFGLHAGLTWRF